MARQNVRLEMHEALFVANNEGGDVTLADGIQHGDVLLIVALSTSVGSADADNLAALHKRMAKAVPNCLNPPPYQKSDTPSKSDEAGMPLNTKSNSKSTRDFFERKPSDNLSYGYQITNFTETMNHLKKIAIAALAAVSLQVNAAEPLVDGPRDEPEPGSSLVFKQAIKSSAWCPERRMLVLDIARPSAVTLEPVKHGVFAIYVDNVFLNQRLFEVTKRRISVCLPRTGAPVVLIYGADSQGLPVEFSSNVDK